MSWRLLAAEERRQLLDEFNVHAEQPSATTTTLVELFEAQVERTPEATALSFGQQRLSYAELNGKANRLAHFLMAKGIGRESLVGIALERSLEMVVAIVGVLKAGAAYVPLDPEYPQSAAGVHAGRRAARGGADDREFAEAAATERRNRVSQSGCGGDRNRR